MFNRKSDYAYNKKDHKAIVYIDADGGVTRLTIRSFANEAEFRKWKELSDSDYKTVEHDGRGYYDNCISLEGLSEAAYAVPSPEDAAIAGDRLQEETELCKRVWESVEAELTDVQRRRFQMLITMNMSVEEISAAEGATHQAISKSLSIAKNILRNFLK